MSRDREQRLRRDVTAYARRRPTKDEIAVGSVPVDWTDLADDTDWDELYREDRR